jgi:hypothetical protein
MRIAFKEWVIVADALARGDQIIILRKGGIAEGPGGFQPEHPEFWLYPTLFHQQRESVVPAAQARFDAIAPALAGPDRVRIQHLARLHSWRRLATLAEAERLRGQHIWRDDVIASRYEWGRNQGIHALALRLCRLPEPVELPVRESYGGCKSWIELERDLPVDLVTPVLAEAAFQQKLAAFNAALDA